MPKAPRLKQSRSSRTSTSLHDPKNPIPSTLTLGDLGVGAMENGRLTNAAMSTISYRYIRYLTPEDRAKVVVRKHRTPGRKDRRKSPSKKPATKGAKQWYCFVCDDHGYKVDRCWKHEVSDCHRYAVVDALGLPDAALPDFKEKFICSQCPPRVPYRRPDQLQAHRRAHHPEHPSLVKTKKAKGTPKTKHTKSAPAKENIPAPLTNVDAARQEPNPELEPQSQRVDSLPKLHLVPTPVALPHQVPGVLARVGPVAVTSQSPQPQPYATQGSSRLVEDRPAPLDDSMAVDSTEDTFEPDIAVEAVAATSQSPQPEHHAIQSSSRLVKDEPAPPLASIAVDSIDIESPEPEIAVEVVAVAPQSPQPEHDTLQDPSRLVEDQPAPPATSIAVDPIEVAPRPKTPVEVLHDLHEDTSPEPETPVDVIYGPDECIPPQLLHLGSVLAATMDTRLQNPWNIDFPDDDPSLSADALFERFCVWS